jgi:chemotaxis protein CheD
MKHTIGVADMLVSANPDAELTTFALGSCLGITIHDPVAKVGGMLHVMLPLSSVNPEKAASNPSMFVDTGVPRLFKDCYKAGAAKERLVVKVAGGASLRCDEKEDHFQIGARNFTLLKKLLWKNGVLMEAYEVGGNVARTMSIHIGTGLVTLKSAEAIKTL